MIKWIKELRSTEKGRVLFKFILYMTFLIFVMALCLATGSTSSLKNNTSKRQSSEDREESTNEVLKLSYFDKQKMLIEDDYEFEYSILIGEDEFNFLGSYENGTTEGFKETRGELVHYKIEDGIPYKMNFNEREEYRELYDGLDTKVFDFEAMFKLLNGSTATIERETTNATYIYVLGDYEYRIRVDEKSIEEIIISNDFVKYKFNFKF